VKAVAEQVVVTTDVWASVTISLRLTQASPLRSETTTQAGRREGPGAQSREVCGRPESAVVKWHG